MIPPLYYECHITVDPIDSDRLDVFDNLAQGNGFRRARLLMVKDGVEQPANRDTFVSAKNVSYKPLHDSMMNYLEALGHFGFKVRRYKIEAVIIDSKVLLQVR